MRRLLEGLWIFSFVLSCSVACSDSNDGNKSSKGNPAPQHDPNNPNGGNTDVVVKPGEGSSQRITLTSNKWCIKARFDNTNYEYRLHFQTNQTLVYTYFYLKPDFTRGDLAQEGHGAWSLSDNTLTTLIADEQAKINIRLEQTSAQGHPQLHFHPETPGHMTFNPCI